MYIEKTGGGGQVENENEKTVGVVPRLLLSAILAALISLVCATALDFPLIVAAAIAAFIAEERAGLPFAAASVAVGGVAGYFIAGAWYLPAKAVAVTAVLAAVIYICRARGAGLFVSSVAIGAAHLALTAGFMALSFYLTCGDVVAGAKTFAKDIYDFAAAELTNMFREGDVYRLSETDVKELLSIMATMAPGLIAAMWQAIGAAVYFIMKLLFRTFGKSASTRGEYVFPDAPIVFFAVSMLLSFIFSLINGAEVIRIAALDIALALSAPTFFNGAATIVRKMKNPETVTLPDGTTVKRSPVGIIVLTVASALINPLFPIGVVLVYSAVVTIKKLVVNSKRKDG